jgi:GAF domain-containing protein
MMNFIRTLSPSTSPAHISKKGELLVVRERILQSILLILGVVVIVALIGLAISGISEQNYIRLLGHVATSAAVIAFVLYRRLPYTLRVLVVVIAIFITAMLTLWNDGFVGNVKLYLLAFVAITSVFLDRRFSIAALFVAEAALIISGYLIVNGRVSLPPAIIASGIVSVQLWNETCIFFGLVASLVVFTITRLIDGLENAFYRVEKLSQDLSKERFSLQERVEKRTEEIQYRMRQVLTASEISQTIVSLRDPAQLLSQIVELIRERFDLYYVGVFIVDKLNNAVLRAGTGEAGAKMVAIGHHLVVGGNSMIGWCIVNRQARVALDVGTEAVRFNNPYLPNTRSEMAIPIISRNEVFGALTIQSDRANAFGQEDIQILQGVANSMAIALENMKLFQQAQEAIEEVRTLNREYLREAWSQVTNEVGNLSYTYEDIDPASSAPGKIVHIPLTLREQVIGQITLETETGDLRPDQLEFIDAVTTQTALALENARLLEETQRRAAQEQTLNQLTTEFSRAFSIDDILKIALRQLSELPAVSEVSVHLAPPAKISQTRATQDGSSSHRGNGKEN